MLDWLDKFLHGIESLIPSPIRDAIQWSISAIASLFGTISGNVSDAWHDFTAHIWALYEGAKTFGENVLHAFSDIFNYWIPKVAWPAFWYVTHPDELASVLFWYLIKWLERRAWTAAKYLGEFALALILRNVHRIALLVEDILAAVL